MSIKCDSRRRTIDGNLYIRGCTVGLHLAIESIYRNVASPTVVVSSCISDIQPPPRPCFKEVFWLYMAFFFISRP